MLQVGGDERGRLSVRDAHIDRTTLVAELPDRARKRAHGDRASRKWRQRARMSLGPPRWSGDATRSTPLVNPHPFAICGVEGLEILFSLLINGEAQLGT